jgi:hypothetical protein
MKELRRHKRVPLVAGLTIQPGDKNPLRFAGTVANICRGGAAVFSQYHFPPGMLAGLELTVPVPGEGLRCVTLFGVTRWVKVQPDGNLLGIEFLADPRAGDYEWFDRNFDLYVAVFGDRKPCRPAALPPKGRRLTPAAEDN